MREWDISLLDLSQQLKCRCAVSLGVLLIQGVSSKPHNPEFGKIGMVARDVASGCFLWVAGGGPPHSTRPCCCYAAQWNLAGFASSTRRNKHGTLRRAQNLQLPVAHTLRTGKQLAPDRRSLRIGSRNCTRCTCMMSLRRPPLPLPGHWHACSWNIATTPR